MTAFKPGDRVRLKGYVVTRLGRDPEEGVVCASPAPSEDLVRVHLEQGGYLTTFPKYLEHAEPPSPASRPARLLFVGGGPLDDGVMRGADLNQGDTPEVSIEAVEMDTKGPLSERYDGTVLNRVRYDLIAWDRDRALAVYMKAQ